MYVLLEGKLENLLNLFCCCLCKIKGVIFDHWQRENLKSWYQGEVEDAYEETNYKTQLLFRFVQSVGN